MNTQANGDLPQKRFARRVEDFRCEHCGHEVAGAGFTNHCPKCLWSKHVDVLPGDRREACQGMMQPVGVEVQQGRYILVHRCLGCGLKRRNRVTADDDFEAVLRVAKEAEA